MNPPQGPRHRHRSRLAALSGSIAFAIAAASCMQVVQGPRGPGETGQFETAPTSPLELASRCLLGNFSSDAQARANPRIRAVDLHLAPIWSDRQDGPWLYLEQAVAEAPNHPFRQRVLRLLPATGERGDPVVLLLSFEIPGDPGPYVGAWQDPGRFNDLEPGLLTPLEGCTITLAVTGPGRLSGGSHGDGCSATQHGAAYRTFECTFTAEWLDLDEKGFSSDGKVVFGGEGPMRFERENPVRPRGVPRISS